jgi:hypothetical protein
VEGVGREEVRCRLDLPERPAADTREAPHGGRVADLVGEGLVRDAGKHGEVELDHPRHHLPAVSRAQAVAAHEARGRADEVLEEELQGGNDLCGRGLAHLVDEALRRPRGPGEYVAELDRAHAAAHRGATGRGGAAAADAGGLAGGGGGGGRVAAGGGGQWRAGWPVT